MPKKPNPLQGLEDALPDYSQGGALPQNLAIQQAGDLRDFGTSNFLGGPGGVNAYGIQTMLDAAGASDGGINLRGGAFPQSPVQGLQAAQPGVQQPKVNIPGVGTGSLANEQELRARRARMVNQEQPKANFYPNATNYTFNPFPSS